MPHPWVYSATMSNDTVTFRVEVTDLRATTGAIEISGIATQVNGAFAPIYRIINMPGAPNGDPNDDDQADRYFLDVEATPTAGQPFKADKDVTVFVRVSKVWVTVLGSGPEKSNVVGAGPTWGKRRADSQVSAPEGEAPVSVTLTPPPPPPG
jgi:hypothetical protein